MRCPFCKEKVNVVSVYELNEVVVESCSACRNKYGMKRCTKVRYVQSIEGNGKVNIPKWNAKIRAIID